MILEEELKEILQKKKLFKEKYKGKEDFTEKV